MCNPYNILLGIYFSSTIVIFSGCGGGGENANAVGNEPLPDDCNYSGEISGELNYTVNHDLTNGCGGAATADSELITSFGGVGSEPNIKIYHENFSPGITSNNRTAHIVIYKNASDERKWQTALGACTINITSSLHNSDTGKVKVSGSGSCNSPAFPDTNSGAVNNISIADFSFKSIWLNWR